MGFSDWLFVGLGRNIRHRHGRFDASTLISQGQGESLSVQALKPSAHVRDSDSSRAGFPSCRQARPVVVDAQRKCFVQASGRNANRSTMSTFRDSVFDRVLYHRLQNQARNVCREKLCRNVDAEFETFGKTYFLDVEILLREVQLFSKRNLLAVGILEDSPEKIAQSGNHVYGCIVSFLAYQPGDGIESVEQKMRFDLAAQCIQLRLRELFVETSSFGLLTRQRFPRVNQPPHQQNHAIKNRVGEQTGIELVQPQLREWFGPRGKCPGIQQ